MASGKPDVKEIFNKIKSMFSKILKNIGNIRTNPAKMTTSQKRKALVYGGGLFLILILLIVIIAVIAHNVHQKKDTAEAGYSFMSDGYEDIVEAESVMEKISVYTDESGKKGIISLTGVITQKADQDKIYSISSEWRKYEIVAENSSSDYLYYVDAESGTVLTRQYQDVTEAPREAVWSEENNSLVWRYSDGTVSSVADGEITLSTGVYPVAYYSGSGVSWGYINQRLELVINHTFEEACDFSEGLAAVKKDGKWGYINESGETIIPFIYDTACSFGNGLAVVSSEGKYGLINRTGAVSCRFDFDNILPGKDGKYLAQKSGKWGLLKVNDDVYDRENTAPSTTEPAAVMYIVSTSGSTLNLRAEPSSTGEILTEIPNGTEVECTETGDGWIKVIYNGYEGWVSAKFVELVG